jgi:hypothetical protein
MMERRLTIPSRGGGIYPSLVTVTCLPLAFLTKAEEFVRCLLSFTLPLPNRPLLYKGEFVQPQRLPCEQAGACACLLLNQTRYNELSKLHDDK